MVFRLTQDEYKRLQKECMVAGARNLSDFTRRELLDKTASKKSIDNLDGRLTKFEKKMSELQVAVRQISKLLRGISNSNS